MVEIREALEQKYQDLEALTEKKRDLVEREPSTAVKEILGEGLPKKLTRELAKVSEKEEALRVQIYLLKRAFLETMIEKDERLIEENQAKRSEVIPKIQELQERQQEIEQELISLGNFENELRWSSNNTRVYLKDNKAKLAALRETGYYQLQ